MSSLLVNCFWSCDWQCTRYFFNPKIHACVFPRFRYLQKYDRVLYTGSFKSHHVNVGFEPSGKLAQLVGGRSTDSWAERKFQFLNLRKFPIPRLLQGVAFSGSFPSDFQRNRSIDTKSSVFSGDESVLSTVALSGCCAGHFLSPNCQSRGCKTWTCEFLHTPLKRYELRSLWEWRLQKSCRRRHVLQVYLPR